MGRYKYVFPRWSNALLPTLLVVGMVAPPYAIYVVAYGFSPRTTDVGYMPKQPVPYSHALHVSQLGIDCRYCHNTVETGAKAAIPPTQTCFNCHSQIVKDSPNLVALWNSYRNGTPVQWVRVHDLPDYAYFNHSAHVNRGVSCVECHGRVDKMEEVYQHERLSMGWCLECHRQPAMHVRDPELVTDLGWESRSNMSEEDRRAIGEMWIELNNISPSQDCSTCHR